MTLEVTLDTNLIIYYLDKDSDELVEEVSQIINLGISGDIDIAITTRLESDLMNDPQEKRRKAIVKRINSFPVIGTVARFGVSKWGAGDFYVGDKHGRKIQQAKEIIFSNLSEDDPKHKSKLNDIDHLVGHYFEERDFFITNDTDFLSKKDELQDKDFKVIHPSDFLEQFGPNSSTN